MQNPVSNQFGNPIVVIQNEEFNTRVYGLEALRSNVKSVCEVADMIKTSFGPKGMDKLILDEDRQLIVTNDGATILQLSGLDSPIARLILELSSSQDRLSGDGTTGVVLACAALLKKMLPLVDSGVHPVCVSRVLNECAKLCESFLPSALVSVPAGGLPRFMEKAVELALCSKVVKRIAPRMARCAIKTVAAVRNPTTGVVNTDLIKVEKKICTNRWMDVELINGLILNKGFYNPRMKPRLENPKIVLITFAFEAPKPKTKNTLEIANAQDFRKAHAFEQDYYHKIVAELRKAGADCVFCQWGADEEAGYLCAAAGINMVTWVGGHELELLSLSTGAEIVSSVEDVVGCRMGTCETIELRQFSTDEKVLVVEKCPHNNTVTVLATAGTKNVLQEMGRSFDDAVGVARTLVEKNDAVVCGGGALEIHFCNLLREKSKEKGGVEAIAMEKYADALLEIPLRLGKNCGLDAELKVQEALKQNREEKRAVFGIGVSKEAGNNNMEENNVFEPAESKMGQLQMATELARMILKIDEIYKEY